MPTSFLTSASVLAENVLYMIGDLPLHTLVVHFAVVMLPLSAMALIAIILVPKWRGAFVWAAMVGLVIGTGAAFVSKESGQQLADHIGQPQLHAKWGDILPWVAVLFLITACLWLWLERRATAAGKASGKRVGSGPQLVVGIIAIGLALISMALTIVVGHTGAAAVWESRSLDSEAVEDAPQVPLASATPAVSAAPAAAAPSPSATAAASGASGYTLAEVAAHATPADCWSAVNATVYDLTAWIPQHPGGPGVIEGMCGVGGTSAYEGQHKGSGSAASALAGFAIGQLK